MKKLLVGLILVLSFTILTAAPGGIGGDLLFWLRAADLATTHNNGDPVAEWLDMSGNDNDAVQTVAGNRPTFHANVINEEPVVRFNKSSLQYLTSNVSVAQAFTIFVVFKSSPAAGFTDPHYIFDSGSGANERAAFSRQPNQGNKEVYRVYAGIEVDLEVEGYHDLFTYATLQFDGDNSIFALSGEQSIQSDPGNNLLGGEGGNFYIGSSNNPAEGHAFNGDVSEIIVYATALNTADRMAVEHDLAGRYAIEHTRTLDDGDSGSFVPVFGGTKVSLNFADITIAGDVTVVYNSKAPKVVSFFGTPPQNYSNYFWTISDDGSIDFSTYTISIEIEGLRGVYADQIDHDNPQTLENGIVVYWRPDSNSDFTVVPTFYNYDTKVLSTYQEELDAFGDFILTSNNSIQTLPVELSTFYATVTSNNNVQLTWVSESETNFLGYNVLRAEEDKLSAASKVNPNIIVGEGNSSQTQEYVFIDTDVEVNKTYYYWLESVDLDMTIQYYGPISIVTEEKGEPGTTPKVEERTRVIGAFPNPFNPGTSIAFELEVVQDVTIEIYNSKGQLIRNLVDNQRFGAGIRNVPWDGKDNRGADMVSGVYMYRFVTASGYEEHNKMLLMK